MGRLKDEQELNELLHILRKIDKNMPKEEDENKKKTNNSKVDRFAELKDQFASRLSKVKGDIKELQKQKNTTRTKDRIAMQQAIRMELKELGKELTELEQLQIKEVKRKRRSRFTKEELATRTELLRYFARELVRIQKLAQRGYVGDVDGTDEDSRANAAMKQSLFSAATSSYISAEEGEGSGNGAISGGFKRTEGSALDSLPSRDQLEIGGGYPSGTNEDLTDQQKSALMQVEETHQMQDEILDEIHESILEAGRMAELIGETAKQQGEMLDEVGVRIEKAQDHLDNVNVKMKQTLDSTGMSIERFCIHFICMIVLLGVIGVIVNLATR